MMRQRFAGEWIARALRRAESDVAVKGSLQKIADQ
jgi:hypothetical protein